MMPPDQRNGSLNKGEDESERLRIENNVLSRVFENRLIFAPLSRPRRILECGYGTSDWAAQVAIQHQRCEVSTELYIKPPSRG